MTIVHTHFVHDDSGIQYSPPAWIDERYATFVRELESRMGSRIEVLSGKLTDVAPDHGFILYAGVHIDLALQDCSLEMRQALTPRVIAINTNVPHILENLLEPLSLAGAIDAPTFAGWQRVNPHRRGTTGLFGRRDLASAIGAKCIAFESDRYCCFTSSVHDNLVHMLSDYLRALAGELQHLPTAKDE